MTPDSSVNLKKQAPYRLHALRIDFIESHHVQLSTKESDPKTIQRDNKSNTEACKNSIAWIGKFLCWITYGADIKNTKKIKDEHIFMQLAQCRLRILQSLLRRDEPLTLTFRKVFKTICVHTNITHLLTQAGIPGEIGFAYELWERILSKFASNNDNNPNCIPFILHPWLIHPNDIAWLAKSQSDCKDIIFYLLEDDSCQLEDENSTIKTMSAKLHDSIRRAALTLSFDLSSEGIKLETRYLKVYQQTFTYSAFFDLSMNIKRFLTDQYHTPKNIENLSYSHAIHSIKSCKKLLSEAHYKLIEQGTNPTAVHRLQRLDLELKRLKEILNVIHYKYKAEPITSLFIKIIEDSAKQNELIPFIRYNFREFTKRIVKSHAHIGHHYIAKTLQDYRPLLVKAILGGIIAAPIVLIKIKLQETDHLNKGLYALAQAINYAFFFLLIQLTGNTLATKQPAFTANYLAHMITEAKPQKSYLNFVNMLILLIRSQFAAIFGNVLGMVITLSIINKSHAFLTIEPIVSDARAIKIVHSHSIMGFSILYATLTGILLWFSAFTSGLLDNWLAYRRFHQNIAKLNSIQKITHLFDRYGINQRSDRNFNAVANNIILAFTLAFSPLILAQIGIFFEPRHVTISAGLNWIAYLNQIEILSQQSIIFSAIGIFFIGFFNVITSYLIAFKIAMLISHLSIQDRRNLYKKALQRLVRKPLLLFFPIAIMEKNHSDQKR